GIAAAPPIYAGSSDPLLEWALRQSGAGLAVLTNGSTHGLEQLALGKAVVAGCHLIDPITGAYNLPAVHAHLPSSRIVVIHWARRTQGLLTAPGNPLGITGLADVAERSLRFATRSEGAGSQRLLDVLLARDGIAPGLITSAPRTAESHADLATMIEMAEADCGIGLKAVAGGLGFQPLVTSESFDLVMNRRDYFEPALQALLQFSRTDAFARRAEHLGGYDISAIGAVRWNG
ncbi:MAG: substrate-binding domain-containing protein, partial [Gemmobacter sp.]|nr:substrate-binding domain-containing protein [Gemmobacter sp.]